MSKAHQSFYADFHAECRAKYEVRQAELSEEEVRPRPRLTLMVQSRPCVVEYGGSVITDGSRNLHLRLFLTVVDCSLKILLVDEGRR